MDKQQATQHILDRLRAGYNQNEITEELSRLLNAPTDAVRSFVDKVVADRPGMVPPVQKPEEIAPKAEIPSPAPVTESHQIDPGAPAITGDLPPGLRALIDDENVSTESQKPISPPQPRNNPETIIPQQAAFVPPTEKADQSSHIDLETLGESVLNQLKKQRRQNDVIEFVCNQTGWHWNKAQRFVARVKTQHHGQLQSRQNTITIVVGIGTILVGFVMAFYGANTISDYAKLASFARTNPEVLLSVSPQTIVLAIAATFTGIGMIVGGGYGIGRILTNH